VPPASVFKPTPSDLLAARGKTLPDVIADDLDVLFVGINPGLYTAAIGHHFGRPGNRFWPALLAGGFTPRLLSPFEESKLIGHGVGITNVVARATAAADEISSEEFVAGGKALEAKVRRHRPRVVAFLGIGAYRTAFARRDAATGLQPETIGGAAVWVLPNPSGLNAHFQAADFGALFRDLRRWLEKKS
jgi:double-stranded uracil-DNA glycosylase